MGFNSDLKNIISSGSGECQGAVGNIFYKFSLIDVNKPLVVTFQNRGEPIPLGEVLSDKAYIWGYPFIKKMNKYNVLSFSCVQIDNWYRDDIFIGNLSRLSSTINVFPKRYGYGSSMGGYAVAAYADILKIESVLLMNPISTLNTTLVPWESRFAEDRHFNWDSSYHDSAATKAKGYIVYDPIFSLDHQHAKRYKNLIHLKVPGVGHAMPAHLRNFGVLKELVEQFLMGSFDSPSFYKKIRCRKLYKGYYRWLLSDENIHLTPKRERIIERHQRTLKAFMQEDSIPSEVINTLRDVAIQLENIDLELSYKCMEIAHEHRPNGPLINQKMQHYKKLRAID